MRLTIAHRRKVAGVLVVLMLAVVGTAHAQTPPDSADDPFAPRSWTLEFGANVAVETWNYNPSHETMHGVWQGFTYGIGKGVTIKAAWPLYYVDQRGTDAVVIGATIGMRGRVLGSARRSFFWEFDLGVSRADTFTPPGGTQFNYLVLGAIGVSARVARRTHLLASLRWVHVSNHSLAGRSRNPDIEAVGPHIGLLLGF